ncbi:hypothetical protein SANTM175S_03589 [Streptomyces antimycoticus]
MAARKTTTTRRTAKKTTAPAKCPTCKGNGETTTEIRVGPWRPEDRTPPDRTVPRLLRLRPRLHLNTTPVAGR